MILHFKGYEFAFVCIGRLQGLYYKCILVSKVYLFKKISRDFVLYVYMTWKTIASEICTI